MSASLWQRPEQRQSIYQPRPFRLIGRFAGLWPGRRIDCCISHGTCWQTSACRTVLVPQKTAVLRHRSDTCEPVP